MLKFHLDEHVSRAIAKGLEWRGIDVSTTAEAGLIGATDGQQAEFALAQSRVIFTNDADFLRLASEGVEHAGIVYCHPQASDVGNVVRYLALMNDCLEPEDMFNKVEFL
ncbi:MAG: DUF5615 family PIN-like protein [Aureliella sp.]